MEKTETNPEIKEEEGEQSVSPEELKKMQDRVKSQIRDLIKLAERSGMNLRDVYPTPPAQTGAITEATPVKEDVEKRVRPGAVYGDPNVPNSPWRPWRKEDLEDKKVPLVPLPIPGLTWPTLDEYGRQKIRLTNNELTCWLTIGEYQEVPEYFAWIYIAALKQWKETEEFKRAGPESAPWGVKNSLTGEKAWFYQPMAPTFGMDIDGNPLVTQPGILGKDVQEAWNENQDQQQQ